MELKEILRVHKEYDDILKTRIKIASDAEKHDPVMADLALSERAINQRKEMLDGKEIIEAFNKGGDTKEQLIRITEYMEEIMPTMKEALKMLSFSAYQIKKNNKNKQ